MITVLSRTTAEGDPDWHSYYQFVQLLSEVKESLIILAGKGKT